MTNNKTVSNRANKLAKFIYREIKGIDEIEAGLITNLYKLPFDDLKGIFEIIDTINALEAKKAKFKEIANLLKLLSVEIRNK